MTRRKILRAGRGRVATVIAVLAGLLAAAGATGAAAQTGPGGVPGNGQWSMAGQNIDDTHYQADEHEISPANVGRLAPRWTLTTAGGISATPTVDDGTVYVPDYGGKLWAVAAGSGRVLWSNDISGYTQVTSACRLKRRHELQKRCF
jgi:polyvinyl alcohol dehydrogenase (cytochrome)